MSTANIHEPDSGSVMEPAIAADELARRPAREPDYAAESHALASLAEEMARSPRSVLQRLAESALELCHAHSSGVSILEEEDGRQIFRWHAAAGGMAPFLGGTMPRESSPCGTVLARNAAMLISHPEKFYPIPPEIPPIIEQLLVPFHIAGKPVGTIWLLAHDNERKFDSEDERLIRSLAAFASSACQILESVDALKAESLERDRAQEALRAANERLRGVLNSATVGVAVLSLDARFQEVNKAFCSITGYSEKELRERTSDHLTHPDDCAKMNPLLRRLLAGLIPSFVLEKRYIRKNGKLIWVRNNVTLVRNERSEPGQILTICEDISDRKRTEDLLEGQKRILEMIATGAKMKDTLNALVRLIEEHSEDGVLGSILVRGQSDQMTSGHFVEGVAPSIGESYISALRHAPITPPYLAPCGRATHLGEDVVTADLEHDPRWAPMWRDLALQHGLQTCYSCPIFASNGAPLGSFTFYYKQARASAIPQNQELIQTATSLAGIAIERVFADETLRRNETQMATDLADSQLLQHISGELIHEDNIEALYQKIMDAATELMHSDCASMQMLDPKRNELELIASKGFHPESVSHFKWVRHDTGSSCGAAIGAGQRIIVEDIDKCDFIVSSPDHYFFQLSEMRAVQSTPLFSRSGDLLGMISTHWREPYRPSERELRLFDVLARQAADLIEHRISDQALRRSEEQFRALFEQTTGGIAQTDLAGKFTRVNDRYCEIVGRSREELLCMRVQEITHPEDVERNMRELIPLAEGRGKDFVIEKRYVRPDGSHVWVRNQVCAIRDADGRPVSLAAAVADITTYRSSEQALRDFTENLERRVGERTAEALAAQRTLRALSARLLQAQDEERRRIARELHDSVGQHLAVLKMSLSMLDPLFGESERKTGGELIAECFSVLDACISETRTISYLLHPPLLDELGLASATHWYVDGFSKRSGIEARLNLPEHLQRLPQNIELALFRILQEALTNVHRHSGSRSVEIQLDCDANCATLTVRDFGCGIPADKLARLQNVGGGGVGMGGMRERIADLVGELQVSSDGTGTFISAKIPLPSTAFPVCLS